MRNQSLDFNKETFNARLDQFSAVCSSRSLPRVSRMLPTPLTLAFP